MLLNDSVELEYNDYSASAEPLPLNWDIKLSQIWIPSNLLPNRKKPINPNEHKPFIFHTLEKPDESKSFSVYTDEYPQYHEPQTSSSVPSGISHHKLMNNNTNKLQIQQVLPLSQKAFELHTRVGIGNKKGIFPPHPVDNNKLDGCLKDPEGTQNAILWGKNPPDNCSFQESSNKASFEDLARRMAEILSEDEPFKEDWHHEDVIKANQGTTSSTLDSIPTSIKDSLEELYYSDDDEDQFDVEEYELGNLDRESPEKNHSCSIYTDNSYIQEQPSESFVNNSNDLEQAKNNNDKTFSKSFEGAAKIPFDSQKIADDNEFNQTEIVKLDKMETVVHSKDSEQELLNYEGKSEGPTEKIVEFPIAYKRPPLQEHTNKTKPQKERKKSKRSKIKIPLEDLFQSKEVDRFKIPEVDEFYENLVRQGKCQPHNQETDIDGFISINLPEKLQTYVHEFPSINFPEKPQTTLFWDSAEKFIQSADSELLSSSPEEIVRSEEKTEPELEPKASLDTIVIDNIPIKESKESIESIILGYGELKKLTIEQHGKFQRAILLMDFNCEVDWIIDCLNDSQPFGSFDKELLKCYRKI